MMPGLILLLVAVRQTLQHQTQKNEWCTVASDVLLARLV